MAKPKIRERKPPAEPKPRDLRGRMTDAQLLKCGGNGCENWAILTGETRRFNKRVAENMALDEKWRVIGGKWLCKACVAAITTAASAKAAPEPLPSQP